MAGPIMMLPPHDIRALMMYRVNKEAPWVPKRLQMVNADNAHGAKVACPWT
jgi:hypothetical protein